LGRLPADTLSIFTSFTHIEPSAQNHTEAHKDFKGQVLKFSGSGLGALPG